MACVNTMLIPDAQLGDDDKWHPVVKNEHGGILWSEKGGYEVFAYALLAAQSQTSVMAYALRHQLRLPFVNLEEVA